MSGWPPITEPELLARLAMDDEEFRAFIGGVISQLPPRNFEAAVSRGRLAIRGSGRLAPTC